MTGKSVLVHVGVSPALQSELEAGGTEKIDRLANKLKLKHVRENRLAQFGVLTGETETSQIEVIRKQPGIEFVEQDTRKRAT